MRHSPIPSWLAAFAALAAASPAHASAWQEQSSVVVPARDIRRVRIENSRGQVTVTPGAPGEIRIEALKRVLGNDEKWARQVLEDTQVLAGPSGSDYVVRATYPQRQEIRVRFWDLFNGDFDLPRVEVRLAVQVPPGTTIELKSTSGDLTSSGVGGTQTIETTSGDVFASGAATVAARTTSGDVRIQTSGGTKLITVSGDVVCDSPRGPIRLETTSGDVRIRGANDSLSVVTVSGDVVVDTAPRGIRVATTSGQIDVRKASGRILARTASGDVGIGLSAPLDRAELATSTGDVQLWFAGDVPCELNFETSSGDIQTEAPLEIQNVTRHHLRAVVRNGRAPVTIRTISGDIRVTEGAR